METLLKSLFVYYKNKILLLIKFLWNAASVINIIKNINNKTTAKLTTNDVALILAGGQSTRFNTDVMKQLYLHNNKHLISYSILALDGLVKHIIIVTNSECELEIQQIVETMKLDTNIHIVVNNVNCRLKSIECGLEYTKDKLHNIKNILLHDSARPFVSRRYMKDILNNTKYYSQYCLKLTNGLMNVDFNVLDRDKYVEMCTPICMNFNLCYFIFMEFIKSKYSYEFVNILRLYNIPMNIMYGHFKYLRKVTYIEDLELIN